MPLLPAAATYFTHFYRRFYPAGQKLSIKGRKVTALPKAETTFGR
jgi:hypothetical protein